MARNTYRLFGVAPAATVGARIANLSPNARASADNCPDTCGLVRVSGNVVANLREGINLAPEVPPSTSQISACPYAKLSISTKDGLGRLLIDIDSSVVLPGRHVCGVEVLTPDTWGVPTPSSLLSGRVWDVHGAIQLCAVEGGSVPLGRLTEFVQVVTGQTATLIRPRGARSVQFLPQAVTQFWELWAGAPGVGIQAGTIIVPVGDSGLVAQLLGITHLRSVAFVPATVDLGVVWEINAL